MMHTLYVAAAYGVSVLALGGLAFWLLRDQSLQKRGLAELEEAGIRRRSDGKP